MEKLKQIEEWYGSDNFAIGTTAHTPARYELTFRFGYFYWVNLKELQQFFPIDEVRQIDYEDEDCGRKFWYVIRGREI